MLLLPFFQSDASHTSPVFSFHNVDFYPSIPVFFYLCSVGDAAADHGALRQLKKNNLPCEAANKETFPVCGVPSKTACVACCECNCGDSDSSDDEIKGKCKSTCESGDDTYVASVDGGCTDPAVVAACDVACPTSAPSASPAPSTAAPN